MAAVEFLILGPLAATLSGRPVELGRSRARRLLVVLLLNAGQVVSIERLVAELWPGVDPPPSARGQLHVLVSQLRRAFDGHQVIETAPGGYRVDPQAVRLDSDVAERLVGDGRLREALALWRGPVLDGLDRPEVRRLEELRRSTAQEWARVELSRDHPEPVVRELAPLLEAYPHDEPLRAQLAIALDRLGRGEEAARVLAEGRSLLDADLGLEPGPDLRQAEQLVGKAGPVPAQLPRTIATFTGREPELRRLSALAPGSAAAVYGPAGIGKSALAVQACHRLAERFPDGQLYANLHGSTPDTEPVEPVEVLGRFLRALGVAASAIPSGEEEAAATFRSLTAGRRLLILLDNAAGAAQVRPLLPGGPGCGVLITSRRMLTTVDNATHHRLDVLDSSDAGALFARLVGAERLEREEQAVAEVIAVCGKLPLALAIIAARLAARPDLPVRALADRLAVEQRRLAELEVDDQAVRASFRISYEDLGGGPAARMFRLLGLLDGPDVSVPVAAALAGMPDRRAAVLLDLLVDNQLAESDVPGRFRMHDLLRLFARERALAEESADERALAVRRALHCHVATARRAAVLVEPTIDWRIDFMPETFSHPGLPLETVEEVHAWLEAEMDNLLAAAHHHAEEPDVAAYLSACLNTPLEQRARFREQLALARLAGEAARHSGDARQEGLADNDIGWSLHSLGRSADALSHFDRALAAWRPIGYDSGLALALHGRGASLRAAGRHEESLAALEEAAALWERLGLQRHESACLTGIGLTYIRLGRHADAIDAHHRSLVLARTSEARVSEVMALGNLGEAHRLAGQIAEAAACFEEALRLDAERGLTGTYWEAEHLWGLGRTLGDREQLKRSAEILLDLGLITYEEARQVELSPEPRTPDAIAQQL